jgi:acyl-[acyl-carrier-protein]-phospholipid O-acyltransferase/long-chain-fatty-acid--[acyl-carrier-protein] ligase
LREHVGLHALAGAKKNFFKDLIIDAFQGGKTLTGGKLMAVSLALSNWIRSNIPEERVGLVLPPGLAGSIANLACVLADKVPVNLNFTAHRGGLESALQRGEITTVLTAQAMKDRLKEFPWPKNSYDIKTLLQELPSWHVKIWWFRLLILPAQVLRIQLGLPRQADRREAALLFTSGSSGEPKGVVLSHRNILANVAQIKAVFWQRPIDSLLGCLPIFHSFGCTVTFWWPLLGGPKVVTYPNPLETAKLAEIIERYRVSVFINTPTFLRSYLRKAKPEQLRSVKAIVTGAEKCPVDLIREFESKFEVPICEGYGMTEATPVVAVNLLSDWAEGIRQTRDSGRRQGSVGPLLPGMDVQIRHPETDELLLSTQSGLLWLKGPNIFNGYLRDPERSHLVLRDGWYKTGDIGRLDAEGFLHIEGRQTRFSKIAGEMVPHGVIEDALRTVLNAQEEEVISFFVTGLPDQQRGEELVVLTTRDWDWAALKQALAANGLPNLWIPKTVKKVEKIPVLATGKLDLHACQELAKQ